MTADQQPNFQIDWSRYLNKDRLTKSLRSQESGLVRLGRKLAITKGIEDLLDYFGWQEIPQGELPIGDGELVVSQNESIVGFQPEDVQAGLCGVAVSPGGAQEIRSARARIFRPESDSHHSVNVPEGPYQLVLVAPQPWTDLNTREIVYYTARAMVASAVNKETGNVSGILTTFSRDKKPIGWMVLNEWSEPGELRYAYRHVPGIVFPEKKGETEAPVLRLHSLAAERQADMPDDVVAVSGLIAVKFFEHRVDTSGRRSGGSRRSLSIVESIFPRQSALEEVLGMYDYRSPSKMLGIDGLTVFEEGKVTAYGVESGGTSKPIGPTVLLSVVSSPESEVAPVVFEGVKLIDHRNPTDEYPSLQALARWGFGDARLLVPET